MFAIADLFIVGTAFDLVGGVLIAKGLLASPRTIALRSGTYVGSNPTAAIGAVEDRVDAEIGLISLGSGFALQALGYFLTLLDEPRVTASAERAFTGLGLAALAALLATVAWRVARPHLMRRNLKQLARWRDEHTVVSDTIHDLPAEGALAGYGRLWQGTVDGETDAETVARVFGNVETRPPSERTHAT